MIKPGLRYFWFVSYYFLLASPLLEWSHESLSVYPEYQVSIIGFPAFITCMSGDNIYWVKSGKIVSTRYILQINSTALEDGGIYKCLKMRSLGGYVTVSSELIVVGKSNIKLKGA